MFRLARTFAMFLSLGGVIASNFFWIRSYRVAGDQVSWLRGSARYTLRSKFGRLTVLGPPNVTRPKEASEWLAKISNDDFRWDVVAWRMENDTFHLTIPCAGGLEGSSMQVEAALIRQPKRVGIQLMLEALEDPRRFIAAHLWLTRQVFPDTAKVESGSADTNPMVCNFNSLRVEVKPPTLPSPAKIRADEEHGERKSVLHLACRPEDVRIDLSQLPAIRRQWHDRFDEPIFSIPYWVPVCIFMVFPIAWIARRWRRSRLVSRRRAGLCLNCGYDLRASSDCCSECGKPIDTSAAEVIRYQKREIQNHG